MKAKKIFLALILSHCASASHADLINYSVTETFYEPAYNGAQNTVFSGNFTYNTTASTITNLTGTLSEAMTPTSFGGPQELLNLIYDPAPSASDGNGGIIASAFLLNTTTTFSTNGPKFEHLAPYDSPTSALTYGNSNAYATIDVNAAQLSGANSTLPNSGFGNLYYGDCTSNGMMGLSCMTGHGVAGTAGTMGGYPISEVVVQTVASVPLPPTSWTFLGSLVGMLCLRANRVNLG
jgi:hypothetical protein